MTPRAEMWRVKGQEVKQAIIQLTASGRPASERLEKKAPLSPKAR